MKEWTWQPGAACVVSWAGWAECKFRGLLGGGFVGCKLMRPRALAAKITATQKHFSPSLKRSPADSKQAFASLTAALYSTGQGSMLSGNTHRCQAQYTWHLLTVQLQTSPSQDRGRQWLLRFATAQWTRKAGAKLHWASRVHMKHQGKNKFSVISN